MHKIKIFLKEIQTTRYKIKNLLIQGSNVIAYGI